MRVFFILTSVPVQSLVTSAEIQLTLIAAVGATHSFAGIAAVRYFLGLCEGAASPAWVIITSNWYKRSEHPLRVAYVHLLPTWGKFT